MNTSLIKLSALALSTAAVMLTSTQAHAYCPVHVTESKINGGRELPDGVPNYDQDTFNPGRGDCSPTAIAQVLGYWDANGWSCMFEDTGPYTGGAQPHPSIEGAVDYFKIALGFKRNKGTLHNPFATWGGAIKSYAVGQDSGASSWAVHDDFWVSQWDVTSEVNSSRPLVFSIGGVSGKQVHWNSPTGPNEMTRAMSHSMAAYGYRHVAESFDLFGWCIDELDPDEFYVVTRSGWRNGGNSEIYYHWGLFDTRTAVKVQPAGSATCDGGTITACPYTNDGECDEPEGLGYCDEGTDVADCSCTWRYDNECDEPQGTGVCPAYSDPGDC